MKMKWIKKGIAVAIGSLAVMPMFAFADGLFTAPPGDLSIKLLGDLFGSAIEGGTGNSPLAPFLNLFNAAMLMAGGVLASYTLIVGTIKTASDGEALGRTWSSAFVPLNFSIAMALLIPTASGLNGAEYIALKGIEQGAGLASNAWKSYVNAFGKDAVVNTANVPVKSLVSKTLQTLVCVEASKSIAQAAPGWSNYAVGAHAGVNVITYASYGSTSGCGSVDFGATIDETVLNSKTLFTQPPVASNIVAAHRQAYADLVSDLTPAAQKLAISEKPDLSVLKSAGIKYQKTIMKAVLAYGATGGDTTGNQASASMSNDAMTKSGWILAPASFIPLIKRQETAGKAASRIPYAVEPQINDLISLTASASVRDALTYTAAQINEDEATHALGISQMQEGSDNGFLTSMDKFFAEHLIGVDLENLNTDQHPLLYFASLGDRYATMGVITTGGIGALSLASALPGKFGKVPETLVSGLAPLLNGFIVICLTLGFTLMYLVPAIPLMIFFGGVASWFLECIIAVFGISMLAALAGNERTGVLENQKHGLVLLLKCITAPFFMIVGLIVGMIVSDLLFKELINPSFLYIMQGSANGLKSFASNVFGGLLYCVISMALLKKSFDFIFHLPDHVWEYVGGGSAPMIGAGAQAAGQALQTATIAASQNIGTVANGMSNTAGGLASGLGKIRDGKANEKAADLLKSTVGDGGGNKPGPKPEATPPAPDSTGGNKTPQ